MDGNLELWQLRILLLPLGAALCVLLGGRLGRMAGVTLKKQGKNAARWMILAVCCMPWVFLAMYGDARWHSMLLYGWLLLVMSAVCQASREAGVIGAGLLGNGFSLISSLLCIQGVTGEDWSSWFKPFSPRGLAIMLSAVMLIVQLAVWLPIFYKTRPQKQKSPFRQSGKQEDSV